MKINSPRLLSALPILLLIALGICAYINCLPNEMFWDDDDFILKNRFIKDWHYFPRFFTDSLVAGSYLVSNYWRPLLLTVFAGEWHLWHGWVYGWHMVSVAAHIGAGVLLYFLLKRLVGQHALALVVAALFITHPVHNEAVVYVNSLGDSLAAIFIFSGLIFYTKFRQSNQSALLSPSYYLSLLSLPFALMSKETGFVLAALIPLTDFLLLQKGAFQQRLAKTFSAVWPFLVLAIIYISLRATVLNFANSFNFYNESNAFTSSVLVRLLTFFKALSQYASFLFFPHDLRVERLLPWGQSLLEPDVFFGGALTGLLLWAGFQYWQKRPLLSFGVGWFFIAIAPASNILVPINAVLYEHFLYLPMVGILILTVDGFLRWSKDRNLGPTLLKILIVVLIIFIGINLRRNNDWRTAVGFYEKLVQQKQAHHEPVSYRVINNLGMEYADKGMLKQSETTYLQALALDPKNPVGHHNLAGTYRDTGRMELAIEHFKKAITLDPRFIFSYRSLADIYYRLGNWEECKKYLSVVAAFDPADKEIQQAMRMIDEKLKN